MYTSTILPVVFVWVWNIGDHTDGGK